MACDEDAVANAGGIVVTGAAGEGGSAGGVVDADLEADAVDGAFTGGMDGVNSAFAVHERLGSLLLPS